MRLPSRTLAALGSLALAAPARAQPAGDSVRTDVVAEGLEAAWAIAFAPDGRIFVTERPGRVRVVVGGRLQEAPWARVPAVDNTRFGQETGLMGIAVDPAFATNGHVYVCHSYFRNEQGLLGNRIVRLTERDGRGTQPHVILDSIPGAFYHDGCRLKFGPDGKLYATMGDGRIEGAAQDMASPSGKILRLERDGTIPADNPVPRSPAWSMGHRNPQGIAWQPGTNRLYATDHGTGGVNELNLVERGSNHGWPVNRDGARDPRFATPVLVHPHPPTGMTFVEGGRYPAWRGSLLFASIRADSLGGHLHRVVLTSDGRGVASEERLLVQRYGRLRDVVQGPDGFLYVVTSNRDGRGQPRPGDDRLLRLRAP